MLAAISGSTVVIGGFQHLLCVGTSSTDNIMFAAAKATTNTAASTATGYNSSAPFLDDDRTPRNNIFALARDALAPNTPPHRFFASPSRRSTR